MMAEFENQIQCQAQRRDHRELQAEAWISEFGAREKMKADEKAQDRTKQNENQEKDTYVFVVPIRPRMLQMMLGSGPMRSQRLLPFVHSQYAANKLRVTASQRIKVSELRDHLEGLRRSDRRFLQPGR